MRLGSGTRLASYPLGVQGVFRCLRIDSHLLHSGWRVSRRRPAAATSRHGRTQCPHPRRRCPPRLPLRLLRRRLRPLLPPWCPNAPCRKLKRWSPTRRRNRPPRRSRQRPSVSSRRVARRARQIHLAPRARAGISRLRWRARGRRVPHHSHRPRRPYRRQPTRCHPDRRRRGSMNRLVPRRIRRARPSPRRRRSRIS